LINELLEFRKSETQNRKLSVKKGDLSAFVQEIGLKFKELNQNNETEINIETPSVQHEIYFDKEVLTIILDNLISNALKYTPRGEINIILRDLIEMDNQFTEIIVSDSGYGISSEALPYIFNRYYQVNGKNQMAGTGIGLSLVKNMVELHEGSISVDSKPEVGTTFTFRLLSENSYPGAIHAVDKEREQQEIEIAQSLKQLILVVEDNIEIRDYVRECFNDSYEVLIAGDGQKGLQIALEKIPDIIISDIMMPIMDGIEMCKHIKEDVKTSHIPVILLTAKDSIQDKTEGYESGADSYITKPFSGKLLLSRVSNLLETRKKIVSLFASSNTQKRNLLKDSLNKLDNEFIDKITAFIEANLESEQINVNQVADQMFMSRPTLYRKLKALTGLSINEFTRKIRIQAAERLLLTGKYTMNEIIFMVGINSMNYFRECFKEEFGVTPKEYIQRIKEDIE
jgi:DNA-binding response OmpR family regulator/anti-sigma regulatory factor (Ser/Thr protein kinase)